MNEADTRANLIEPKLKAAGWTDRQVTREYYCQRDHQYAPGRIILIGDQVRRGTSRRIDYLLQIRSQLPKTGDSEEILRQPRQERANH